MNIPRREQPGQGHGTMAPKYPKGHPRMGWDRSVGTQRQDKKHWVLITRKPICLAIRMNVLIV